MKFTKFNSKTMFLLNLSADCVLSNCLTMSVHNHQGSRPQSGDLCKDIMYSIFIQYVHSSDANTLEHIFLLVQD